MATKEKQIDLFEKAVGHPPHVLEIEEGQKSDFDLKAIKGISAMGLDQEVTSPELTEKIDEYDVAEEAVSYTHLDVYKRQVLRQCVVYNLALLGKPDFRLLMRCYIRQI